MPTKKSSSFPKVDPKQSFPKLEEQILAYWQKEKIFEESVSREPRAKKDFVFYDGPPFATGLPHYGHILQGVIKDLIPRYKTMQGYRVPRVWGWDCHGLPVENLIEKELNLPDKSALEKYGISKFNEACRASVLKYATEWKKTVRRMGRWIDMEHDYRTMTPEYMESVWWVFGELWKKGLIYEGLKPMHICPRCVTPLSNFEVGQGYKDITDLSAIAKFKVVGEENTYLLAWTTTPWTLPGNVALAVNPKVEYVKIQQKDETIICSQTFYENLEKYLNQQIEKAGGSKKLGGNETPSALQPEFDKIMDELDALRHAEVFNSKEFKLIGLEYEPLFPYFTDQKEKGAFKVVAADFVTTEDGTGIVHIAPAFGEDDMNIAKKENLPTIQHVTMEGKFTAEVTDWASESVKPADDVMKTDRKIVKWLEEQGKLFKSENYKHSYAHCWRCDTPLLNYATKSWFVAVEKLKDKLLANNKKINWIPEHIRDGRFGKWLEGARDWAISRTRYWGTPLPVWRCDTCEETVCVSSIKELEKLSGEKVEDLHKHFVDELTWPCKCKGKLRRVPEVLDCWFESGSMPYAQAATKEQTKLPADFIAEAQDQTRGWFYTLHVLATALQDKPAYANVICSGLILAEDGQKMSKSKQNYPDPQKIFDSYGADAMRLYLMNSPVVEAQELRFSERGVEETLRSVLLPLWNTYYFFTTYANADNWEKSDLPADLPNPLDQWILSELNILIRQMTSALEKYEINAAVRPLASFLDGLTNWYIRRSRRRFWKSESDTDKCTAYSVLHHVLITTAKLLAPVCPFLAEEIYHNLTNKKSVHLEDWPTTDEARIDYQLSEEITATRHIVSLGLAIRAREKIKVRQPLTKVTIAIPDSLKNSFSGGSKGTIQEELNVKKIEFAENSDEIAKTIVTVNARTLGPRLGKKVQECIQEAKKGNFEIKKDGVHVASEVLTGEEVSVGFKGKEGLATESEAGITVALDTHLTPELKLEGRARDLVRAIQDLRKQADYDVSDRIELALTGAKDLLANKELKTYIQAETLAEKISDSIEKPDAETEAEGIKIAVKKLQK